MNEVKVSQQYDRLAAIYEQRWHFYLTRSLQFLQNWLAVSETDEILDVGCGTGLFAEVLAQKNATQTVTGIDISAKMLKVAQNKLLAYPNINFYQASANHLPFSDQRFDIVICVSTFHYFDEPRTALLEMRRVLKPQGKIIILDWCRDYFFCKLCDIVLKIIDPVHQQCYTQTEFHQLLTSTSLTIKRAEKFQFGLIWGMMIAESA